jgi:type IV pilus assembly protein PilY1
MRTLAQCWPRSFTAALAAVALLVATGDAGAQQTDTNPPLPNVLLLIDNSGSMERMIDGNTPETDPSTSLPATATGNNSCNCFESAPGVISCPSWSVGGGVAAAPNRWNIVQTALTGSLQSGFNCVQMQRSAGSTFASEYQIAGQVPYDTNYYLPFHRLVARDTSAGNPGVACVVAPGALPGAAASSGVGPTGSAFPANKASDFPSGSIVARQYGKLGASAVACGAAGTQGAVPGFLQYPDGAITTMRDLMRFGMMTFDSDPDPGTGVTGIYPTATVGGSPFLGMWTYNWAGSGVTVPPQGDPVNCTSPLQNIAVGVRNQSAPPWEGRMVGFQAPATPDLAHQESNNDEVSNVILATRPYGATPTAGMFSAAQYYFWNDPSGPKTDPYVTGNCRSEYIIFLTDGAPNLDYQPSCSQTSTASPPVPGTCPFPIPYAATGTAATLYANGVSTSSQSSVKTYVIGFAVSTVQDNGTPANCSLFAQGGTLSSQCNCNDPNLPAAVGTGVGAGQIGPCCVLQCLAQAGGTKSAYFAQTQGDLQNALGSILADIAKDTTTRTTPAFSPVLSTVPTGTSTTQSNESIFLASFNPSPGLPWSGDLQRQRYVCTYAGSGYTIPPPVITNSQGDDFAANLNSLATNPRVFIGYQPMTTATGAAASGAGTIRPWATPGIDGVGLNTATAYVGAATSLDTQILPAGLGIAAPCNYTSKLNGSLQQLTKTMCSTMLLDYTFGLQSFSGQPSDFPFVSRFGNALGSIYHATPTVVGPPGSLLQDPGYIGFAAQWQAQPTPSFHMGSCPAGATCRNTIVYAPTNDGLLHAFWADETTLENNELWAMLLPAAMPNINGGSYPSSHAFLADGAPIVKDVVWDRSTGTASSSEAGPISAPGDPQAWHTMLVAGYGSSQTGYYAVDVTNPDPKALPASSTLPTDPWPLGPVFRWQLTTMPNGNMPLFGAHSATPAITTLYMDPDGSGAREIGVAILPGGEDVVPSTQIPCTRQAKLTDANPPSGTGYAWRPSVRCWGNPTAPNPTKAGTPQASTDFVQGRSVTIVRIDTGEILHVFSRKQDLAYFPGDTVSKLNGGTANGRRFTDVQLDSPMTGTPVVYPNDVGTDATKFFIGDADGTVWRFDLSSQQPSNWVGEIYLDLYNSTADTSVTAWSDGQPLQVPPVLSLDPAAEVVLNVASGSTDQFDTSGTEYVYSITEKVSTSGTPVKLRASVNWWMQPAVIDTLPGERVSGPMTVFNGTLYFSTFGVPASTAQVCSSGYARIWGRDFVTPSNPSNLSLGGLQELQPPPANPWIEPDITDPTLAGKVIPGVSIKATPACANLGTPAADQYVYGAQHAAPQNYAQTGGFSVFSQVGTKGTNGSATKQVSLNVATPVSPTLIDSWAAVLE